MYISDVQDGARRMIRLRPDLVGETDHRWKALNPGPIGRVLWKYPAAWMMSHPTGYWKSAIIPKLEEIVSIETWETSLGDGIKDKRSAGGE